MKYNSVSSGPSSEVIWKCWFTRTEENIIHEQHHSSHQTKPLGDRLRIGKTNFLN